MRLESLLYICEEAMSDTTAGARLQTLTRRCACDLSLEGEVSTSKKKMKKKMKKKKERAQSCAYLKNPVPSPSREKARMRVCELVQSRSILYTLVQVHRLHR